MNNKNLGERIRELREDQDVKQMTLANELSIQNNTLSQYESMTRIPEYTQIKKICLRFNVSSDYLLGLTNKKVPLINDELADIMIKYINSSHDSKRRIIQILEEGDE